MEVLLISLLRRFSQVLLPCSLLLLLRCPWKNKQTLQSQTGAHNSRTRALSIFQDSWELKRTDSLHTGPRSALSLSPTRASTPRSRPQDECQALLTTNNALLPWLLHLALSRPCCRPRFDVPKGLNLRLESGITTSCFRFTTSITE